MDYLQFKELIHSGVKGMKWGIRRYTNEDGTLTEAGKARYNPDYTRKKAREMSDEDLRRSSNRLQAEQTYERLSETRGQRAAKKTAAIGASVIGSFLLGSGGSYAYSAIESKSFKVEKDKLNRALLVGGLTAVTALVTGAVSAVGGHTTSSQDIESKIPKQNAGGKKK